MRFYVPLFALLLTTSTSFSEAASGLRGGDEVNGVQGRVLSSVTLEKPSVVATSVDDAYTFSGCKVFQVTAGSLTSANIITVSTTGGSVSLGDISGVTVTSDDFLQTGETPVNGTKSLVFSGTDTAAVNAAFDGMKYTNSEAGRFLLTISIDDGATATVSMAVTVNAKIDIATVRSQLTEGVTQVHSATQPGRMVAFEKTAHPILMYPGDNSHKEGPVAVAGTLGKGKVLAMPDHQMLDMNSYKDVSGTFYKNGLKWLLEGKADPLSAKIVTRSSNVQDYLVAQGYTNVIKINWWDTNWLLTQIVDADLFVGHLGTSATDQFMETFMEFATNGGAMFLCEYGVGYQWWWSGEVSEGPANRLLRDAGMGFAYGYKWKWGAMDVIIPPADSKHFTADQVVRMLEDESSFTSKELEEGGSVMNYIYQALPEGDPITCKIDIIFSQRISTINPLPSAPVTKTDTFEKALLNRERDIFKKTPPREVVKHRLADATYGAVPNDAPRITITNTFNGDRNGWHATGAYAAPGELLTVTVSQAIVDHGARIRVNAHTDDINKRETWERVPVVHRHFDIKSTTTEIANGFGGAVFIDLKGDRRSPSPGLGTQTVTVTNAVEHPYFDLTKHTDEDWINGLRNKPAPFAVFSSPNALLVQPADESYDLEVPTEIMLWWEKWLWWQDDLIGYHYNETIDVDGKSFTMPPRTRNEIANVDVQISAGAAHSGYPYQCYDKHWGNLVDPKKLKTGSWGDFHEVGHNLQARWWTFSGDGDVANNILSALGVDKMVGYDYGGWGWTYDQVKTMEKALKEPKGKAYSLRKDLGIRLSFWLVLRHAFGWDAFKTLFTWYEIDKIKQANSDAKLLPKSNTDEKDQVYIRLSQVVNYDMSKYMVEQWGLEVSETAKQTVADLGLEPWLPAFGGITKIVVPPGESSITFDLKESAKTFDGVVEIIINDVDSSGNITENEDGTFTYLPAEGHLGSDGHFSYSVVSSTGFPHTTKAEIHVDYVPQGHVDAFFKNSGYSGRWKENPDKVVSGKPIWEHTEKDYIAFWCGWLWGIHKKSSIENLVQNGSGGCGAYSHGYQTELGHGPFYYYSNVASFIEPTI